MENAMLLGLNTEVQECKIEQITPRQQSIRGWNKERRSVGKERPRFKL